MRLKNQWRVIPNHPNYEISIDGRIHRIDTGYVRKLFPDHDGYLITTLDYKTVRVHQLVLVTFVGDCPPNHECNHKNSIRSDNYLYNLEWVTHTGNMEHAAQAGRMIKPGVKGERNAWATLKEGEVWLIRKLCDSPLKLYQKDIGKMFNVHQTTIGYIKSQKTWSHI